MAVLLAARRWWALPAAAVLVAGCAIPDRQNPYDPVNAPPPLLPVVRVVDLGPTASPAAAAGEISLVSRDHCVGLDASQSSDPQGNGLEFAFLWEDGNGGNGIDLDAPDLSFPAVAVLSSSLRADMPAVPRSLRHTANANPLYALA